MRRRPNLPHVAASLAHHTRSIRRVVAVRDDVAQLVTVEGSPLAAGGEGGWYYVDQLERVPGEEPEPEPTPAPPPPAPALRLSPSDRLRLLSHVIDDLPEDAAGELVRHVAGACFAVVRHLQGTATEAEARAHVERARATLLAAAKGTSTIERI